MPCKAFVARGNAGIFIIAANKVCQGGERVGVFKLVMHVKPAAVPLYVVSAGADGVRLIERRNIKRDAQSVCVGLVRTQFGHAEKRRELVVIIGQGIAVGRRFVDEPYLFVCKIQFDVYHVQGAVLLRIVIYRDTVLRAVGIPVGSRSRRFAGKYGFVAAVKTAAESIRRIARENRQRGDGYHD